MSFGGWGRPSPASVARARARPRAQPTAKAAKQTNAEQTTIKQTNTQRECYLLGVRHGAVMSLTRNQNKGDAMTKAPLTAYEAALRARRITAACTLAHQRAIKATKEALRARGLRVTNYSHREISLLAVEYAKRNGEELLNDAAETIERWRMEGFFGKRAQAIGNVPLLAPPAAQSVRIPPQIRTLPASEAYGHRGIQR